MRVPDADGVDLRLLSCGAGVQSTTLALMSIRGELPPIDGAVFADTGWEPRAVYEHLDHLEQTLAAAGVPLYRVAKGNLRNDSLDPEHRYASVPYFVLNPPFTVKEPTGWEPCDPHHGNVVDVDGVTACALCRDRPGFREVTWLERPATLAERRGMGRRQCTSEYKLGPINRKVRELLGAAAPEYRRVPRGRVCEQWIGFSLDELTRVSDRNEVSYITKRYPLIDLGMTRDDCKRWLRRAGWTSVEKSACIGCPYHGNRQWRDLRDNRPDEWADAVAFDAAIRKGGARGLPLHGQAFLHQSRVPLDQAPIDRITAAEWADRQVDLFDVIADQELENGDPDGCSPYGCRSGMPVAVS